MKNQMMLYIAVAAVVAGGAGFFGGVKFQENKQPFYGNYFRQFNGRDGQLDGRVGGQMMGRSNGQMMGRGGMGRVMGEILSIDDKSVTVKLQDGSSKIVLLTDNTTYTKSDTGAKTDLKTGTTVGVFGTANNDGSVTAQDIQINPILRGIVGDSDIKK